MFNFYQPKPEPKCLCESLIESLITLSYSDSILLGIGFLLLSAFILYLLRGTPLLDWIEKAGRVQNANRNDRRRTVAVQTTLTQNRGDIRNSQNADIKGIHCRDNGNDIQVFPDAENDANIKNTKTMKRDNCGASPSRIPIFKHAQQATVNNATTDTENLQKYNNNAENENPANGTNKREASQIPSLTKRNP